MKRHCDVNTKGATNTTPCCSMSRSRCCWLLLALLFSLQTPQSESLVTPRTSATATRALYRQASTAPAFHMTQDPTENDGTPSHSTRDVAQEQQQGPILSTFVESQEYDKDEKKESLNSGMTAQERILREAGVWKDDEVVLEKQPTMDELIQKDKIRKTGVAILSILFAVLNYAWQYSHPITPIQLLAEMQQSSVPMSTIGTNGKPSVVDFWAPWCENCKLAAPTLQKVEEEYRDRINFVMVNGDQAQAWPYIEAFGVDAIPHLALVSAEGDVETALIGPVPKSVLEADLDMLIENATKEKQPLPYKMLDAFANQPDKRRVHFDP